MADSKKYNGSTWQHSLRKYGTDTDTFTTIPATIIADGTNASVGLKGNMSQAGTPTPTTPITPSECGERTRNLFDKDASAESGTVIMPNTVVYTDHKVGSSNGSYTAYLPCKPNTTYRITKIKSARLRCGTTSDVPAKGVALDDYVAAVDGNATTVTINASENAKYICFFYYNSSYDTLSESEIRASIQVEEGSNATPYEPYGYKLPIISRGKNLFDKDNAYVQPTLSNIYLGTISTTRRIKKMVLTGDESIRYDSQNVRFYFSLDNSLIIGLRITPMLCSHYQCIDDGRPLADIPDNSIYSSDVKYGRWFIKDIDYTSAADLKSFLAQQYAAGTPVTIWYILATPETVTINEPIRKISDYADTVSMGQAGVQIPTVEGNTVVDVLTELKPSEIEIEYTGWHDANVKAWDGDSWE